MTTVLTFSTNETTQRCDAQCHNAKQEECDCICGGRFHGKGEREVLREIDAQGDRIIKSINKDRSVRFVPVQKSLGI